MADNPQTTNSRLLIELGNIYNVDGDLMRCVECRRSQHVDYAHENFQHAHGCGKSEYPIQKPWREIKSIMVRV
jgi:hypothetical protein